MANLRDFKNKNTVFTGTDSIVVPNGTTAQRSGTELGQLRYNTDTGLAEFYTANGWAAVESPPVVATVSPTTFNGESGTVITVNGTNFKTGAIVTFITNGGSEYAATTTFVNSTQLTAPTPRVFTVAEEPLDVKVTNPSGSQATLENAIDCGGIPSWSTASGTIATINDEYGSYSPIATIAATDPDSRPITYSVESGSLPGNTSLNTSNGQITGNPNNVASSTTFTFTAGAADPAGNKATRSFSIIVNPVNDGSSSARAATSATAINALSSGNFSNGVYWINLPTVGATQVYCNMEWNDPTHGRGWMLAGKVEGGSTYFNIISSNWSSVTTTGTATTINDSANMKSNVWNYFAHNVVSMSYQNGNPSSTNWFNFTHNQNITLNAIFSWDNVNNGYIPFNEYNTHVVSGATPSAYTTALGYGNIGGSPYGAVGLNVFMTTGSSGERRNANQMTDGNNGSGARMGFLGDNSVGGPVWPGQNGGPDDFALGIGIQSCYDARGCNVIDATSPATHSRWDVQGWTSNNNFRPVNPHIWVK